MKKLFRKLFPTFALTCGLLMVAGCASNPPSPSRIARMQFIAEAAAYDGASIDLIANPQHRPAFQAGLAALNLLLSNGDLSPDAFAAALQSLPIKELHGAQGSLIINNAIILYKEYAAETINLDKTVYLKPIITSVRDGLSRALN